MLHFCENFWRTDGFRFFAVIKLFFIPTLIVIVSMVLVSAYNHHPDEIHHFEAANYYQDHFLPPAIGDPQIRNSYSVYGVSYLNYHWAEYLFAGKFIWLLSLLNVDSLIAARFSNVFLFSCLAIFFLYKSHWCGEEFIFACFLLVTPQIWYIFSYFNNDAFPLFVSLLAAYQIGSPQSRFNKYLQGLRFSSTLSGGFFFGVLIGLLLIAKTNYVSFLIFVILWLAVSSPIDRRTLKKYALIIIVAASILTFRCGLDFYVNGETNFVGLSYVNYFLGNFEKGGGKLLAYQEEIAEKPFKPSTIENDLAGTDSFMKLKAKGVPFSELFTRLRWHEISFESFVGVYGYMTIFAGWTYYRLMTLLYILFGLYCVIAIVISKNKQSILQLSATLSAGLLTVFLSAYLSWSYAFQAQGRYLFPVIAMVALLIYANRRFFSNIVINAFVIAAFLLSFYSFVFVGIAKINAQ